MAAAALALLITLLVTYGRARVGLEGDELVAGKAHIPLRFVGDVVALDAEGVRRQAGVDADARAYLLLRPYLKRGVRIDITDPADPTPYWLVSCRRPGRAPDRARVGAEGLTRPPRNRRSHHRGEPAGHTSG